MTYIIHRWETPSVDCPASVCLRLESSPCHIVCVQNDPTSASVPEMSKWVVWLFGLQLPPETLPAFERQDTCKCVLMFTYMHTPVQAQEWAHTPIVRLWWSTDKHYPVFFNGYFQEFFRKVAIQKTYENVYNLWMEVGISSESRRWENSITYVWNCATQKARYVQAHC